jgi:transposase
MGEVITIGLDIAKSVFQVHGVDGVGAVVIRKRLSRAKVLEFFAGLPRCLIGIEACPGAHHWARELQALGHTVKLMPPSYVKAYLKRSKNDANDAAAICEAVTRPSIRFVAVKTGEQQAALMLHRARQLLVRQRTMLSNAIRGHLAELGIVSAKGRNGADELLEIIANDADSRIPLAARSVHQRKAPIKPPSQARDPQQNSSLQQRPLISWLRSLVASDRPQGTKSATLRTWPQMRPCYLQSSER